MIFLELLKPHGIDYRVYYEASHMLWHGLNPYHGIYSSTFPFNYPPPAFLFIWPLGLLSFTTAAPFWNFGSLLAVLISIYLLLKIKSSRVNILAFLFSSLLFTLPFFPVKFNLGNGQINHFILLFCVAAIYLYQKKKYVFASALLGYAIAIKLAPLVFLLEYISERDFKQVARVFLFVGLFFLLPFAFLSWNFQSPYYTKIFFYSFTLGAKDWYYNQSLEGFLARSFHSPWAILASTYTLTFAILLLTYLKSRSLNYFRRLSALSSLYLLIHPIALQHYFSFAIIPLIFLARNLVATRASKLAWFVLIISYLLIMGNLKTPYDFPLDLRFLISHQFFGILFLWLLALWQEKIALMLLLLYCSLIISAYTLNLLCHAKICF